MIKSAKIENFRGFSVAEVTNCNRINIVVGKNASGKTAFLEALFMAVSANPAIANRLRAWRGYELSFSGPVEEVEDALWRDLFHKLNTNAPVKITLEGTDQHARSLQIAYGGVDKTTLNKESEKETRGAALRESVIFEWRGPDNKVSGRARPRWDGNTIEFDWEIHPSKMDVQTNFFAANRLFSSAEAAQRFSVLSRVGKRNDIVSLFANLFEGIEDMNIEIYAGVPMISSTIPGTNQKRPINLLSGGISKLVSILLAIPSNPRGVVLIDEIEAGFHHSMQKDVWRSLLKFCDAYDVQVFTTTHSKECLEAAAEIAKDNPNDFTIIKARNNTLRQGSGKELVDALNDDIEIR